MKKTFLAKRNAILSSESASLGALAVVFAILVLLVRLLAPNVFWYVFSPAFAVSNMIADKSSVFIASFRDTAMLSFKNEELIKENAALASENQTLIKKIENLSALLGSPVVQGTTGILSGVVSRPPESPYDTLLISSGSEDGVVSGMEAFGIGGAPLGIVSAVMKHYSRITLFSSPGVTVNGWVGNASVPISIRGEGGGAMSAAVARSAEIAVSDIVYAPGPGMLTIGSVARIDSESSSPSVTLLIQPSVNLFSLGWVTLRDTGRVPANLETQ